MGKLSDGIKVRGNWKLLTFGQAKVLHEAGCEVVCWNLYGQGDVDAVNDFMAGDRTVGWRFDEGWMMLDKFECAFFAEVE